MKDIHQAITNKMIDRLNQGAVPWQQPWKTLPAANLVSGNPYRDVNALLLNTASFGCPYWVTFKQASDLGGHVKAGEKALPVVFYKLLEASSDDREDRKRIPFLRYANVFNLEQTEGIEVPTVDKKIAGQPLSAAKKIVAEFTLCPIQGGPAAGYSPISDCIRMPDIALFSRDEEYFHTLFHEMGHATGHPSRLDRHGVDPGNVSFGSDPYSKEELIAEMTACFLSNEAGTLSEVVFTNSSAYVSSWLKALGDDHRLVLSAASQAQRAADLICNRRLEISSEMDVPNQQTPEEQGLRPKLVESTHLSIR